MTPKKKLIEVALPLDAINKACAREKSIRHGHPSTLHLWWARRPLAAARAVIFAQMVDDPSAYVDVLRADPKLKRKAETVLKARLKLWEEARTLADKAEGTGMPVPEPGPEPTLDEVLADQERERLFRIIEDLVLWENTTNEKVLQAARDEIWASWRRACAENADHPRAAELFDRHKLPAFHDPFAGGGALPLEAQRLGLESYASDLNPVAVLINKAMIEIPPKFAGRPPVNPESRGKMFGQDEQDLQEGKNNPDNPVNPVKSSYWRGAQGLAEDVRYYGQWMRDEAEKRIGHLYPKIEITAEMARERPDLAPYVGRQLTVIAWLWARTVRSPNPAFAHVDVPLASTFMLSTKAGKEAYVEPVIFGQDLQDYQDEKPGNNPVHPVNPVKTSGYRFTVKVGKPKDAGAAKLGTTAGKRAAFRCLMSGVPVTYDYIREQGKAGRIGSRLLAIVAQGNRARVYLPPSDDMEAVASKACPEWKPDCEMPKKHRNFQPPVYGLNNLGDLFTPRQLEALTTFSDLVQEARERIRLDALDAGQSDEGKGLRDEGQNATAYAEALGVYLAFAISKLADRGSSICTWFTERDSTRNTFARQAIPMTWDYAELNTLLDGTGSFLGAIGWTAESIEGVAAGFGSSFGVSDQIDATSQSISLDKVVSTDPPYYDNIGYADLSDFFYVWLRRSLRPIFPDLFSTLAVPKAEELVAMAHRHGSKDKAETFFLDGMTRAMRRLAEQGHPHFPVTIYYAFKQAESDGMDGTTNTGWDTFLAAVIEAGFAISGTWPMRTELGNRMIGAGANALASSIVLVCRKRPADAPTATRREFVTALKAELPAALAHLQRGNIAPVDLAQAAIGPGMAVYTRYARVLDAEGKPLSVREALALINQTLDEALAEQEGDFDADSRWALTWFEQQGFAEGEFGVAEQLSKSKNTSVAGMVEAGILESKRGKVRLLPPDELPADWDPAKDARLTAWECVHQLIRALGTGGESAAAALVAKLGAKAEVARELCYRLYTLCERKKRAEDALAYNGLVQSWPEIVRLARDVKTHSPVQEELF
jgi:putative DNA methylase